MLVFATAPSFLCSGLQIWAPKTLKTYVSVEVLVFIQKTQVEAFFKENTLASTRMLSALRLISSLNRQLRML